MVINLGLSFTLDFSKNKLDNNLDDHFLFLNRFRPDSFIQLDVYKVIKSYSDQKVFSSLTIDISMKILYRHEWWSRYFTPKHSMIFFFFFHCCGCASITYDRMSRVLKTHFTSRSKFTKSRESFSIDNFFFYLGSMPQLTCWGALLPLVDDVDAADAPAAVDQLRLQRRGTILVYVSVPFLTRHDTVLVTGCGQKSLEIERERNGGYYWQVYGPLQVNYSPAVSN